jgi:tight adherence protein C
MSLEIFLLYAALPVASLAILIMAVLAALPLQAAANDELPQDATTSRALFGPLTNPLAKLLPDFFPDKARRDLLRSGYYHPAAYDNYLALRNLLTACCLVTTLCWAIAVDDSTNLSLYVLGGGAILTALVYSLPRLYLSWRGDRRAEKILVGIPDALDVIVMGMTGGLSLQQALERTSQELQSAHPELATEFQIVSRQSASSSLDYALRRFAQRADEDELTALTQLIGHEERLGSPLGLVLQHQADRLREKRMQRAEERGNKIALKMLFPVVLCLAPAAFIVIFAPPLLNLKEFRERESKTGGALAQPDLGKRANTQTAPRANPSAGKLTPDHK